MRRGKEVREHDGREFDAQNEIGICARGHQCGGVDEISGEIAFVCIPAGGYCRNSRDIITTIERARPVQPAIVGPDSLSTQHSRSGLIGHMGSVADEGFPHWP